MQWSHVHTFEKILQGKNTKRRLVFCKTLSNEHTIISAMHKIQHLSLNNINLYEMDAAIMIAISSPLANIIQHGGLLKLNLSSCEFDTDDFVSIITSIQNSPLQELMLESMNIDESYAKVIADTIQKSSLVSLSLRWCNFYNSAFSIILAAIVGSSVQKFELSDHHYTIEETMAISNCIVNSSLTKLHLRGKHKSDKIATLTEACARSSLKKLHIDCSDFNYRIDEIVTLIMQTGIVELNLVCFRITREQLSAIIDAIKRNGRFECISFSCTPDCRKNIDLICDLLENSAIKKIKLDNCQLSDAHIKKLIGSIAKSALSSICLQNNFIYNKGVRSLCSLLKHCNIEKMNLSGNKFDFGIIESLLPLIRESSLIVFNVGTSERSKLSTDVKRELKSILREQQRIANRFHKVKSAGFNSAPTVSMID